MLSSVLLCNISGSAPEMINVHLTLCTTKLFGNQAIDSLKNAQDDPLFNLKYLFFVFLPNVYVTELVYDIHCAKFSMSSLQLLLLRIGLAGGLQNCFTKTDISNEWLLLLLLLLLLVWLLLLLAVLLLLLLMLVFVELLKLLLFKDFIDVPLIVDESPASGACNCLRSSEQSCPCLTSDAVRGTGCGS